MIQKIDHIKYQLDDGTALPRVSEVLDEWGAMGDGLMKWAIWEATRGNDYKQVRQRAADIGTNVHTLIERHLGAETEELMELNDEDTEKMEVSFKSFLEWYANNDLKPLYLEKEFRSEKWMLGGTADFIGWLNEEFVLIDWKTSGKHHKRYQVQLAAYNLLWEDARKEDEPKLEACGVLRLPKNGKPAELRLDNEWAREETIFKNLLSVHREHQELANWSFSR